MSVWLLVVVCLNCVDSTQVMGIHNSLEECQTAASKERLRTVCINAVLMERKALQKK